MFSDPVNKDDDPGDDAHPKLHIHAEVGIPEGTDLYVGAHYTSGDGTETLVYTLPATIFETDEVHITLEIHSPFHGVRGLNGVPAWPVGESDVTNNSTQQA